MKNNEDERADPNDKKIVKDGRTGGEDKTGCEEDNTEDDAGKNADPLNEYRSMTFNLYNKSSSKIRGIKITNTTKIAKTMLFLKIHPEEVWGLDGSSLKDKDIKI